jgi:hypothetical protein
MLDATPVLTKAFNKSYRYFARTVLKIKTDNGIEPFDFNQVQDYIDYRANDQLERKGYIRLIGVKARQQGFSEYVSGRGYKYATQNLAKTVYILSHEAASTAKLFAKVDRYYRYAPPSTKPAEVASNRNQKKWNNESEYTVGTAGSENTGRSDTVQFAHISEPAHYADDEGIKSGLLQTVSDKPNTEIWWESTANGMNWFHGFVMAALAGKNEYEVIFIPWFWSEKYALKAPPNFNRTEEEKELAKQGTRFNRFTKTIDSCPLTDDQLYWRRQKIGVLGERLFKQEYPATLEEAFQSSGNAFIDSMLVSKARNSILEETYGANILGVDPAHTGDRVVIAFRKGRQVKQLWVYDTQIEEMTDKRLKGILKKLIDEHEIDKCNIDISGGYGVIERLKDDGYSAVVEAVSFAESPDEEQYLNKRAEMFFRFRDWLKDGEVRIPNTDDIATDIASLPDAETTDTGKWKFASKKDIKKNYGKSPDILDAIALTFAIKVRPKEANAIATRYTENVKYGFSELTTAARIRQGEGETSQPLREKRSLKRNENFGGW